MVSCFADRDLTINVDFEPELHLREIIFSNGIVISSDRGLDIFRGEDDGGSRLCKLTRVHYFELASAMVPRPQHNEKRFPLGPTYHAKDKIKHYFDSLPRVTGIVTDFSMNKGYGFLAFGMDCSAMLEVFFPAKVAPALP